MRMMTTRQRIQQLPTTLAPFLLWAMVQAACPPAGCGPFGECLLDTRGCHSTNTSTSTSNCEYNCRCNLGYFGTDCSVQATTCPGNIEGQPGLINCFNGGTCYQTPSGTDDDDGADVENKPWHCNCTTGGRGSWGSVYAGLQCEYQAQVSCERGVSASTYAFCTNGGRCLAVVKPGEAFQGCQCYGRYEGRHCQYIQGTAPPEELNYAGSLDHRHGLTGWAIALIVLAALAFALLACYIIYTTPYRHYEQAPRDLQLHDKDDPAPSPGHPESEHDHVVTGKEAEPPTEWEEGEAEMI